MTLSIILLLLIIVTLFEHDSTFHFPNGLIHKGKLFKSEDFPYVVYINLYDPKSKDYSLCTGTLVKEFYVLTAGHCCIGHNPSDIEVCQGSPLVKKPNYHSVVEIHLPKEYSDIRNDICVLKLEKAFPNIKTFSKIGGSTNDFANGKKLNCIMIGFGLTGDDKRDGDSGYTMTADVVHGRRACKNPDGPRNKANWQHYLCIVPNNVSTICLGDSGGPMICNNLQYGVCSFFYPYIGNESKCGYPYQQGVYMFLVRNKKWLQNIIEPKQKEKKKKKKKKRNSGNLLKPCHYTLHIILSILLYNMLTFI